MSVNTVGPKGLDLSARSIADWAYVEWITVGPTEMVGTWKSRGNPGQTLLWKGPGFLYSGLLGQNTGTITFIEEFQTASASTR